MKTKRISRWMLMSLFTIGIFAGCSKEDEKGIVIGNEADLIGTWFMLHNEGYEKENGEISDTWTEDYKKGSKSEYMTFHADYTYEATEWIGQAPYEKGYWTYKNGIIATTDKKGKAINYPMKTLQLTSSDMILEQSAREQDGQETYEFYQKSIHQKLD